MKDNPSFVVIGGGTGTFSVLTGLKKYTDNITAIVNMADSGGSAKKERDEWGLLPSSDIRKSLVALSDTSNQDSLLLRELFRYRYSEGKGIRGMTFGNLFLVALTKLLGSQTEAIQKAGELLHIKGQVLPVTKTKSNLEAVYEDDTHVIGEHFIDDPKHNGKLAIKKLTLTPAALITPQARESIERADELIIGPGGFYTTILATLVVKGVVAAIRKSRAKKIFVMNLMTEYGQTYGFTSNRFLAELNTYLPVSLLNYVLVNSTPIPETIAERYKRFQAAPVVNDFTATTPFQIIAEDLLTKRVEEKEKGDMLKRSLIRHSPEKIARVCMRIAGLV